VRFEYRRRSADEQFLWEYGGEHAQELAEWVSIGNDPQHVREASKRLIELMDAGDKDATAQRASWSSAYGCTESGSGGRLPGRGPCYVRTETNEAWGKRSHPPGGR
jgi:hypothetical protein